MKLQHLSIYTGVLLVLGFLLFIHGSAQEKKITKKDVPAAVLTAFEKAYPKAVIRGYAKETEGGKTYFEIESKNGGSSLDVLYLPDGTLTEVEEGLTASDLPDPVKAAINGKYPKARTTKVEKTTRGSEVTYEVKISSGTTRANVTIDPAGKILKDKKASVKKEKEEDEEED
jgi:hypothetical protein